MSRPGQASTASPFLVLMPVFNDWAAAWILLDALDDVFVRGSLAAEVLMVDDGSTARPAPPRLACRAITRVDVLTLRRNLGHQRAIAVGLAFAYEHLQHDAIVVMDADGEDRPEDVPRLVAQLQRDKGEAVVFAERLRRSEGLLFTVLYQVYRLAHKVLTGVSVRVGNFSAVPRQLLGSIVAVSELWNHYAAAVFKARLPHTSIPTHRGKRLQGHSSMHLVTLIAHGLSAMSVFGDVIGVRLLVASLAFAALGVIGLIAILFVKLGTTLAIPGWATYATGLLVVAIIQLVVASCLFVFMILAARSNIGFLPHRDFPYFVARCETVFSRQHVD